MKKYIQELMDLFEGSFINESNELILCPKTNLYFRLEDVNSFEDCCYKIVAWCSRDASKSEPYHTQSRNKKYREYVRININEFLGTDFTEDDWLDIYCKYGCGCNKEECIEFVKEKILKG